VKKVLLITDTWSPQVNGVVNTWKNLIKISKENNFNIEVIHPFLFFNITWPFYKEIKIPLVRYKTIVNLIKGSDPDYIHIATEGILGWHARNYCVKNNYSFSTSYHTKFPEFLSSLYWIPKALTYSVIRNFHNASESTLVNTSTMKKELGDLNFNNLIEWTRGVDKETFKPTYDKKIRGLMNPENKEKVILYVGRISKEKNLINLCKLSKKNHHHQFVLVGDGPLKKKLSNQFPKIIFPGYKFGNELAKYYSNADCSVFPSKNDTFGNTILESISCGTPVAGYPVNGPMDIIKNNISGYTHKDLSIAISKSLDCDENKIMNSINKFTWDECFKIFKKSIIKLI
tara:strand:- start:458 stop:1486 length:1029 start_codon:yes stop_codon:yes gene_type:complete